jgi:uncharacterized iron-regulated protein
MFCRWFRRFGGSESGLAGRLAVAALGALGAVPTVATTGCASSTAHAPASAPTAPSSPASRASGTPLPADIVERSALPLHALAGAEVIAEPELWERMSRSRVVCLGERHDSPQHHFAQRRAIEELARRSAAPARPLAVGLEMFQRPYQAALSSYVGGDLPEDQFLVASEYQQRWGFDFALYRPLLEAARDRRLAALALNAPRELTRKIGRSGLAALEPAEREQLPELDLRDSEHRSYFDAAMAGHPMPAGGPRLDDMYAVQVVWDETMADTAARWLESAGDASQLIVLAGAGHCHQRAIPARLSRRIGAPVLSVSAVLASELSAYRDRDRYDWLLVLDDERDGSS